MVKIETMTNFSADFISAMKTAGEHDIDDGATHFGFTISTVE